MTIESDKTSVISCVISRYFVDYVGELMAIKYQIFNKGKIFGPEDLLGLFSYPLCRGEEP